MLLDIGAGTGAATLAAQQFLDLKSTAWRRFDLGTAEDLSARLITKKEKEPYKTARKAKAGASFLL